MSDTIPDEDVGDNVKLLSASNVVCNFKEGKYGGIISEMPDNLLLLLFFKYNLLFIAFKSTEQFSKLSIGC